MFAERERERERDRREERERDVCSFLISSVFFYSGNSSTYFKVCVDLCKKI